MKGKRGIGKKAEDLACGYLLEKGFIILERNYTCRFGEIDIIAKNEKAIVFIEVKARFSDRYGSAIEAVTVSKCKKVKKTALHYITNHNKEPAFFRFDILCIDYQACDSSLKIELIENAYEF